MFRCNKCKSLGIFAPFMTSQRCAGNKKFNTECIFRIKWKSPGASKKNSVNEGIFLKVFNSPRPWQSALNLYIAYYLTIIIGNFQSSIYLVVTKYTNETFTSHLGDKLQRTDCTATLAVKWKLNLDSVTRYTTQYCVGVGALILTDTTEIMLISCHVISVFGAQVWQCRHHKIYHNPITMKIPYFFFVSIIYFVWWKPQVITIFSATITRLPFILRSSTWTQQNVVPFIFIQFQPNTYITDKTNTQTR